MAAKQILFLDKNKADPDYAEAGSASTASEVPELAHLAIDRKNSTAWQTDDSLDANNTTYTHNFNRVVEIDTLIGLGHNFKDFDIEYFNGSVWQAFTITTGGTTQITGFTAENFFYEVDKVSDVEQVRITIKATQVADQPKILTQFITTEKIGRLAGWPVQSGIRVGRETQAVDALDGLSYVIDRQGGYSGRLDVSNYSLQNDLDIIDELYNRIEGFLYWPCGGDESQFTPLVEGYRLKDIYLCRFVGQFSPDKNRGIYNNGVRFSANVVQVLR